MFCDCIHFIYRKCSTLDFLAFRTLQLRHCVGDVFDTSTDEDTNLADLISQNNLAWVSEEKLREDKSSDSSHSDSGNASIIFCGKINEHQMTGNQM